MAYVGAGLVRVRLSDMAVHNQQAARHAQKDINLHAPAVSVINIAFFCVLKVSAETQLEKKKCLVSMGNASPMLGALLLVLPLSEFHLHFISDESDRTQ